MTSRSQARRLPLAPLMPQNTVHALACPPEGRRKKCFKLLIRHLYTQGLTRQQIWACFSFWTGC